MIANDLVTRPDDGEVVVVLLFDVWMHPLTCDFFIFFSLFLCVGRGQAIRDAHEDFIINIKVFLIALLG